VVDEPVDHGGEALAMANALEPVVVVMDGKMPVLDGVLATQYLCSLHPGIKIVAHTSDPSLGAEMVLARGAGAH
jgi:CheY-like chemotaxis protein